MTLKAKLNNTRIRILALILLLMLISAPIAPVTYAGECSTQNSGSC